MLESFLDYIARTNLFNFIIFAGIITYLFFKLDFIGALDSGKDFVAEHIEDSKNAKTESEAKLKAAEEKIANIENEVSDIISASEANAKLIGEKIMSDMNISLESIKNNLEKLVESKTALLKNDILKRASAASVELAKNQIIKELDNNKELHEKLIDDSVDAIERVDL